MRFVTWHRQSLFFAASALSVLSLDAFVDDTDLNIVYSPANKWVQGATCGTSCAIQPDVPSVHDGTWHYATYDPIQDSTPPSITYKFTASTIAVRNILPPLAPTAPTSHVELAFELDGGPQPGFSYSPSGDSVFTYGRVVYFSGNIAYGEHTLVIRVPPGQAAVVLFDCLELTVPDQASQPAAPSSQSSSSTTQIAPVTTTTTSSPQRSSNQITNQITTTSSTTSSTTGTSSSTTQSNLQASAHAATLSSDSTGTSNTPSTGTASSASSGGTATTTSPESSSTVAPQSQPGASTGSSSVMSAAIGGAVGGGSLLIILLAALCVHNVRRTRRRHASVGNEAPSQDWATAGGADDGAGSITQAPYRGLGPTVVHRPRLQGFSEDPFTDGSEHIGFLASGTAPSGDVATHHGEPSASNLFAGTAASLALLHPASLRHWDTGEKTSMAGSPAHASPRPLLSSENSESGASLAHTENSSQHLVDPSPRLGEQLVEQLVALREEVAQMRQHREDAVLLEAPPRYDEAQ